MKPIAIHDNVFWCGMLHPELKIFDDLMPTTNGTSYNSYFVRGSEKCAVIDTAKHIFQESYLSGLQLITPLEDIDYIVVNHAEPDHSGSLRALADAVPNATILCSKPCSMFIEALSNRPYNLKVVGEGDTVDLGGKTLRFIMAPLLHWPDTMFTYCEEDRLLFSCDAFGSHFCAPMLFNDLCVDYGRDFRVYYDVIMKPFAAKVVEAIHKIEGLHIDMICPSHGPILRRDPWNAVRLYKEWSSPQVTVEGKTVSILYFSAHGCTKKMADALAEGVRAGGAACDVVHITEQDSESLFHALARADGVLWGSSTINRDAPPPIWSALGYAGLCKGKPTAVFGSYGWSGEAKKYIEGRLEAVGAKMQDSGLRVNLSPSDEDLDACRAFGSAFAKGL